MRDVIKETLAFSELTPEEKEQRGILGRLYGPCADFINPTRNGRTYSDELWEKVFEQPLVKEKLANGGIFGELDHPADRQEVCSEKIAICMPEAPKKDKDGHLIAYFDILDTPCGRIAYQLAKYGYKLGVSSRGTGDVIGDSVDPDTYDFECFDLVLTPSVESARMTMQEGLDTNNIKMKQALQESLNKADADEKKIMTETLHNLNIDINTDNSADIDDNKDSKQTIDESNEANNDGLDDMVKSLQEAIVEKTKLEKEIKSLQEKLAVSDTKVNELTEEVGRYKSTTARLSSVAHSSKELSTKVSTLEEELEKKEKLIENLKSRNQRLVENNRKAIRKPITESIVKEDTSKVQELNESINDYKNQVNELTEALTKEKESSKTIVEELEIKVSKSQKLVEKYKNFTNDVVERYISKQANILGVKPEEIKNRLSESYTLDEIDEICENLQSYALNISKLPFTLDRKVKMKVTESKKEPLRGRTLTEKTIDDDDIDDSLIKMAGLDR